MLTAPEEARLTADQIKVFQETWVDGTKITYAYPLSVAATDKAWTAAMNSPAVQGLAEALQLALTDFADEDCPLDHRLEGTKCWMDEGRTALAAFYSRFGRPE